jgi:hypothetical protein
LQISAPRIFAALAKVLATKVSILGYIKPTVHSWVSHKLLHWIEGFHNLGVSASGEQMQRPRPIQPGQEALSHLSASRFSDVTPAMPARP